MSFLPKCYLAWLVTENYPIKSKIYVRTTGFISLHDNAINTLTGNTHMFGLYAWMYEQESQNTSNRVKETLKTRAKNGLFQGSNPPMVMKCGMENCLFEMMKHQTLSDAFLKNI